MENDRDLAFRPYVDALLDQLEKHSGRAVLRYLDHDVTGRTLRSAIYRYARALAALGIGRGALVAQLAPNCPDALAIRYAANLLGAATSRKPLTSFPMRWMATWSSSASVLRLHASTDSRAHSRICRCAHK
jgi:fatty-acyl-CoA synthase